MSKKITAEDIEAAFAEESPQSTDRCIVGRVVDEYPPLAPRIMNVEGYSGATVSRVLGKLGITVMSRDGQRRTPQAEAINKHRRGVCCCKETTV